MRIDSKLILSDRVYVQDLIWAARQELAPLILEHRAHVYVCGDAKNMAKQVEQCLIKLLAEALGGSQEIEGAAVLRQMKESRVSLLRNTFLRC